MVSSFPIRLDPVLNSEGGQIYRRSSRVYFGFNLVGFILSSKEERRGSFSIARLSTAASGDRFDTIEEATFTLLLRWSQSPCGLKFLRAGPNA